MRDFKANQDIVYYKNYLGNTDAVDSEGYYTGSHEVTYGDLKIFKACVSASSGSSSVRYSTELRAIEEYDSFTDYDRLISTTDTSLDIAEQSILWIDGADTTGNPNYMVTKISKWKNSLLIAIKEYMVTL